MDEPKWVAWLEFHDKAEAELQRRFPDYNIRFGIAHIASFNARIVGENGMWSNEVAIEREAWRSPDGGIDFERHGADIIERVSDLLKVLVRPDFVEDKSGKTSQAIE